MIFRKCAYNDMWVNIKHHLDRIERRHGGGNHSPTDDMSAYCSSGALRTSSTPLLFIVVALFSTENTYQISSYLIIFILFQTKQIEQINKPKL